MTLKLIMGVDPGIIHTGVVGLMMDPVKKEFTSWHETVVGCDPVDVGEALERQTYGVPDHVFIEKYNPRSHFVHDAEMVAAVNTLKQKLPNAAVINNMGSKKVVRRPLLEQLDLWDFPTTHHQDLEAAARILVFGMLKNDELNEMLADFVRDLYAATPWRKR